MCFLWKFALYSLIFASYNHYENENLSIKYKGGPLYSENNSKYKGAPCIWGSLIFGKTRYIIVVSERENARVHDREFPFGDGAGAAQHGGLVEQVPYRIHRRLRYPRHRQETESRHVRIYP
jgi:hypothetical protein